MSEFNTYRDSKVHVMHEECSTCIFRPHERPVLGSRVAEMVKSTLAQDGATVVCHHTLMTEPQENAICRGWYDRLADRDTVLMLAKALGIIVEQEER